MAIHYSIHSIRNYSVSGRSKLILPSPKLNYKITIPKELSSKILTPPVAPKKAAPLLGSVSSAGAKVSGDLSGLFRNVLSLFYKSQGKQTPAGLTALGFTNAFGLVLGGLGVHTGVKEIKSSDKISDAVGRVLGYFKALGGGLWVAGAGALFSSRLLTLGEMLTASKTAAAASGILGKVGGHGASLGSLLASITGGVRLFELHSFRSQIKAKLNGLPEQEKVSQGFQFLKGWISISKEEREEIRKTFPNATPKELEEKEGLLLTRKKEIFKRVAGSDCLSLVQEKGIEDAQVVFKTVQKAIQTKLILSSISFGLLLAWTIIAAALLILATPEILAIMPFVSIALSIGNLANDTYLWIKELMTASSGTYDKAWIIFSVVLAVLGSGLSVALTDGLAPLIASISFGALWLGIDLLGYKVTG